MSAKRAALVTSIRNGRLGYEDLGLLTGQGTPLRLRAGQTENRDGFQPETGHYGRLGRHVTRSIAPRFPGKTPNEKGPENFRALVDGGAGGI